MVMISLGVTPCVRRMFNAPKNKEKNFPVETNLHGLKRSRRLSDIYPRTLGLARLFYN
jgi:hypothetical protein